MFGAFSLRGASSYLHVASIACSHLSFAELINGGSPVGASMHRLPGDGRHVRQDVR